MPNILPDNHKTPNHKSPNHKNPGCETAASQEVTDDPVAEMPDWLPKKFWDAEKGEIRVQALVKSYRSLEKRLSSIVSSAEEDDSTEKPPSKSTAKSDIKSSEKPEVESADEETLSAEDFSDDADILLEMRAAADREALSQAFGGIEKWSKLQPRLVAWGRRNLPSDIYAALSGSVEGIKTLHRLMQSSASEPQMVGGGEVPQAPDESRLRKMMQDPRYWRDREPEFINRVLSGFRQLYDN